MQQVQTVLYRLRLELREHISDKEFEWLDLHIRTADRQCYTNA